MPNRTEADLLPSPAHAARRGEQVHPRSLQRLRIAAGTVPVQKADVPGISREGPHVRVVKDHMLEVNCES